MKFCPGWRWDVGTCLCKQLFGIHTGSRAKVMEGTLVSTLGSRSGSGPEESRQNRTLGDQIIEATRILTARRLCFLIGAQQNACHSVKTGKNKLVYLEKWIR